MYLDNTYPVTFQFSYTNIVNVGTSNLNIQFSTPSPVSFDFGYIVILKGLSFVGRIGVNLGSLVPSEAPILVGLELYKQGARLGGVFGGEFFIPMRSIDRIFPIPRGAEIDQIRPIDSIAQNMTRMVNGGSWFTSVDFVQVIVTAYIKEVDSKGAMK